MTDEISRDIMSQITIHSKYAKYVPESKRKETWDEIVLRNMSMHLKKYPQHAEEISLAFQYVFDKKVLPSMRSLQFGGKPIEISPNRLYNCCYAPIDDWFIFPEIMFLLLGGTGVGYSVQKHHVEKLPEIRKPTNRKRRHLIGDSIEGWAEAIKVLVKAYFFGLSDPEFDFSDIRPKGALLRTSGGRAPGPQPLKDCIHNLRKILDAKNSGDKLTTLECHDMICYIADAVLAGGIRRAALIALFSLDDEEMLTCKYGNWYETNPQRARANNSAVVLRHRIKKKEFKELWKKIQLSGCGEPGIYFSNNMEWGANPCVEIALRPFQFCNLTTINVSDVETQEELNARAKAAAFIGTLQAGYTDFHFLRDEWKKNTDKDALIGVSMTGIASGNVLKLNLSEAAEAVKEENIRVAKMIGINPAARTTCIKPEGTVSCVVGTSSGIHAWHNDYYVRRMIVNKEEPIHKYLSAKLPELMEDSFSKPNLESVLSIPIKAPKNAILRNEPALELLERVKRFSDEWIKPGHIHGDNSHNVSATVNIKEDEWDEVGEWMWQNKDSYNGLSVLPANNNVYVQMPFEDCTKYKYDKMLEVLTKIDLSEVTEESDTTNFGEEIACAGGKCEVV
jgi:ribonucleoside-triphosphate reductase